MTLVSYINTRVHMGLYTYNDKNEYIHNKIAALGDVSYTAKQSSCSPSDVQIELPPAQIYENMRIYENNHELSLSIVYNHSFSRPFRYPSTFKPLIPEFKIPAKPINARDKMVAPRREPISVRITLYSPFLQSKQLQYGFLYVCP